VFDVATEVLIAGGGACGAAAALAARDAGAEVVLIEQDLSPSGTTSMSQGLICAGGTRAQADLGVEDSPDLFFEDILAKTRGQTDKVLARTIADGAAATLDWLVERHDLPFALDIRFRAAYGHSRPRVHGWPGHGGADLLQLLHARVATAEVDVILGARLREIFPDEAGRIAGIEVERPGGGLERIGCRALVLAMGGFGANREMVARYMPEAAKALYNGHEGSRGDAMTLAARLGAALADMGSYQGYGMLTDPQGVSVPPGVLIEGGVMVNARGERFVNETADIAGIVHPVLAQPGGTAWVIFDAAIEALCAYIPETQQLMALNAARVGDNAADLAARIGVDAARLESALEEVRGAKADGRPDRLGRTWSDAAPPVAPLRALKVKGALYHTQGGIRVDACARALRPDGTGLANLFAGGGSAAGVSGPSFWGYLPAMGLCAATTLGRIAGGSAAGAAAMENSTSSAGRRA
jgi:fumarate reductase flavoprotein subunit